MQGIKSNFSVDALKVCYQMKSEAYNKLTENPIENPFFVFTSPNYIDVHTEDFRLRRVKNSKFDFQILIPSENLKGEFSVFGDLTIKSADDPDFSGKCFIKLDNRRLYEPFAVHHEVIEYKKDNKNISKNINVLEYISNYTKIKQKLRVPAKTLKIQYNTIFFLEEMVSRLALQLVSISNLEVAYDSNINFAKLLKKTVADENFIPVINKKKYPNIDSREKIKNVMIIYSTRRKRIANFAYYIKQSKGLLRLKCYDKCEEIDEDSKKTYIYDWLSMNKNIHRMEITAKREPINSFCKKNKMSLTEFLYSLYTPENLSEAFCLWLGKLIYFKKASNRNGNDISVFDLVSLKRKNK